ncbi:hypothetical protein NLG97_g2559 [Lecanicillium saksenae]|uniref:Uncharacterized protein n=1 Tax=Lecanicillium saksenae TaxID=468837 RepID=A0ACC1R0K1_9HYPO|nr:hypothetical protein NLG97_g2559 [Lecanicillium saksenae]
MRPASANQVKEWLAQYAPERAEGMEPDDFEFLDPDFDYSDDINGGLVESKDMEKIILNHLQNAEDIEKMDCILHRETNWRPAPIDTGCLYRYGELKFEVTEVLHQCEPSQRDKVYVEEYTDPHPRLPHVQCWLHDDTSLSDDLYLTIAELHTILVVALGVVAHRPYRKALVIPVTVYSCSYRQIRIVQGCVDFYNARCDVRCGPVEDFSTGGLRQSPETEAAFYRILGWVCVFAAMVLACSCIHVLPTASCVIIHPAKVPLLIAPEALQLLKGHLPELPAVDVAPKGPSGLAPAGGGFNLAHPVEQV